MKTFNIIASMVLGSLIMMSCNQGSSKKDDATQQPDTFQYYVEKFADLKILRYQVFGFDELNTNQKVMLYYLSQAALAGRDITFDQNGKYNLAIRKTLENILETYKGNRSTNDFNEFLVYTKRVWFSNGIYHHYSTDKILPGFSQQYFLELVKNSDASKFTLPKGKTLEQFLTGITPVMFDPNVFPKRVWQDPSKDLVLNSACNYYEGVTEKEASKFYNSMKNPNDSTPISYGLNSKLIKQNGKFIEKIYKIDDMYGPAIVEIVKWLDKAKDYAENQQQKQSIETLIEYYKTGDLKTWDKYNIEWVEDTASQVDFVNGFIEVYGDPLALKAGWESTVNFKNIEATKRTEIMSANAQWFENNSPVDKRYKREVKGVIAKVITVAQLGGECFPATPIGINLPNANWIRKDYGSKSVTIENITYAYDQASLKSGFLEEFAANQEEIDLARKYGYIAGNLHTDLHECLGHGSGQLMPGITADNLKNYHSTIEEARADLFALYYMMDNKMIDLGLLPSLDAAKAEYMSYIRNGLITQLVRIETGKNIEEAHMRNRQLIAKWCYEKGKAENVIEFYQNNGKTYLKINDYEKLNKLFGNLLAEIQRITSEGDYEAAKQIVENYGVVVDQKLLAEIKERYAKLNLAPYSGFINPVLVPVEKDGKVIDVKIEYPLDYTKQMLEYGHKFSFLPIEN
jgi:dipeptidyl-peptidase-3